MLNLIILKKLESIKRMRLNNQIKIKALLFPMIAAAMIIGCKNNNNKFKIKTHENAFIDINHIKRPSFKPMSLKEYKASYPDIKGLNCGIENSLISI